MDSGSYTTTPTAAPQVTSSSGSLDEQGHENSRYDSTFSWTNDDWTATRIDSRDIESHSHHSSGTSTDTSWSSGNGSTGSSLNWQTHDKVDHQEGSASGTATQTVTGGVVTWNQSRSGLLRGRGNPAKVIRRRFPDEIVTELLAIAWWNWPIEMISRNLPAIVGADIDALRRAAE